MLVVLSEPAAQAAEQLLLITGNPAPGMAGAQVAGVSGATLNEAGQIALQVTLKTGVGGVTAANSSTVWRIAGATQEVLARTGSPAPQGGAFESFQAVTLSDAGQALIAGTSTGGRQGRWQYAAGGAAGSTVAIAGESPSADLVDARLETIGVNLLQTPAGDVAFDGKMLVGVGGVSNANDRGLWLSADGSNGLLAREGSGAVPGAAGEDFNVLTPHGVNELSQTSVLASLKLHGASVTAANMQGIWRLQDGGGTLIARTGVGDVPELPAAAFAALGPPTINGSGQIAFAAELALAGGVTAEDQRGVWFYDESDAALVARSGTAAPETGGALFAEFAAPLLSDGGQLLVPAILASGSSGVTDANAYGLWLMDADGGQLAARTHSGGVPGIPGASFATLDAVALNEQGLVALQASLAPGLGGVTTANNQGLWLLDSAGGGVLVARRGQSIGGRTVASLQFVGGSGGGDGRQRALNSRGQLVYKATFTNGDEALLLHTTDSLNFAADFNGDGRVDGADLARWRSNFGLASNALKSQGNADGDGDVDGADLMRWQQQFSASGAAPVPEPRAALLCGLALAPAMARRRLKS